MHRTSVLGAAAVAFATACADAPPGPDPLEADVLFSHASVPVGALNFVAPASGDQEVPANASRARGNAVFHVNEDGTAIDYKLIVANIENAFVSHIHIAPPGENGPVAVFLFGPIPIPSGRLNGVIAEGTITEEDLIGPLLDQPLGALIDAIREGRAYVNVHTNDGVAPGGTGPGDLPGGEVRGQIRGGHVH